jgi:hypothetical protein
VSRVGALVGALIGVALLWIVGVSVLTTGRTTNESPTETVQPRTQETTAPQPTTTPDEPITPANPPDNSGEGDEDDEGDSGASGPSLPADWTTFRDPLSGYRVAYPRGWEVDEVYRTATEAANDFREPGTGRYLRVAWRKPPGESAYGTWRSYSKTFASQHSGYETIRIDRTTYRGYDNAAEWEYRYEGVHAINLGVVTGEYGFALNFQTRESDWERSQQTFELMKRLFVPPSK